MEYKEEDFLLISGIQHFDFCPRQWALIHVEDQWEENVKTVEGYINHDRCHQEAFTELRGDVLITRGLRVFSRSLGVTGQCDVVEFNRTEAGCVLAQRPGLWQPYPVEYKNGKPKTIDADRLQLCCQAMCLEEMLQVDIPVGALYYATPHHREEVVFTKELRNKLQQILAEMHKYYAAGYTPKVKKQKGCSACSLNNICLPSLHKVQPVKDYYDDFLAGIDR